MFRDSSQLATQIFICCTNDYFSKFGYFLIKMMFITNLIISKVLNQYCNVYSICSLVLDAKWMGMRGSTLGLAG